MHDRSEIGIALAQDADPYLSLCAEYHRQRGLLNKPCGSETDADAAFARWMAVEDRMTSCRATTAAGALAGLRIAHADVLEFYDGDITPQGRFVAALIASAIGVLERHVG